MRILDKESIRFELDKLGMQEHELERFRQAFHRPHGAVLTTGPTGSGKSTSLYGALPELNTPEKNIITIEDPVEYQIEGITQVQVNNKAGLTFAAGLRSMMRADPDILMVGEIRDRETAQIAIEGALTGHMVLSTLHTNDAPSAITRLIEMGIEPFLVASAIDCVVAQRLARTLCAHCKRRTIIPAEVLRDHGFRAQFDDRGLRARRLRALRRDGLSRPDRPVRGDVDVRGDPLADAAARVRGPDRRGRGPRGHAPAARGRPGQGQGRASPRWPRSRASRAAANPSRPVHVRAAGQQDPRATADNRSDAHTVFPEGNLGCSSISPTCCSRSSTAGRRTCTSPPARPRWCACAVGSRRWRASRSSRRPTRARSSTRSCPRASARSSRTTGSSTSPTRSRARPGSASTPTSSARRSAPRSA